MSTSRYRIIFSSPALSFAGFTLWLLAFPMAGPLQAGREIPNALWLFLLPHILVLVLLAVSPARVLRTVSTGGTLLAMLATLAFALAPPFAEVAIVMAGIGAAAMVIKVGVKLSRSEDPAFSAFTGLLLANLLLAAMAMLPLAIWVKFLVVVVLMAPALASFPGRKGQGHEKQLLPVLFFAFIYHLVSGFLYGYIFPLYQQTAWLAGVELVPYCLAVALALFLLKKHQNTPLFVGVLLAIAACISLYPMSDFGVNLGMLLMQGAAGFVDLFLVVYLVTRKNPAQSFAAGCATICSGILAGSLVSGVLSARPAILVFTASVILNLAALSLFLVYRQKRNEFTRKPQQNVQDAHLSRLLSEREYMVLQMVKGGARYREVAQAMSISESSVKTYMNRVFEKTQTRGKKQLLRHLQDQTLLSQDSGGKA